MTFLIGWFRLTAFGQFNPTLTMEWYSFNFPSLTSNRWNDFIGPCSKSIITLFSVPLSALLLGIWKTWLMNSEFLLYKSLQLTYSRSSSITFPCFDSQVSMHEMTFFLTEWSLIIMTFLYRFFISRLCHHLI